MVPYKSIIFGLAFIFITICSFLLYFTDQGKTSEVEMAQINLMIVFIFIFCHSIKWIPNTYEILQVRHDIVSWLKTISVNRLISLLNTIHFLIFSSSQASRLVEMVETKPRTAYQNQYADHRQCPQMMTRKRIGQDGWNKSLTYRIFFLLSIAVLTILSIFSSEEQVENKVYTHHTVLPVICHSTKHIWFTI